MNHLKNYNTVDTNFLLMDKLSYIFLYYQATLS